VFASYRHGGCGTLRKTLSLNSDLPIRLNYHGIASICIWGEHPIAPVPFIRLRRQVQDVFLRRKLRFQERQSMRDYAFDKLLREDEIFCRGRDAALRRPDSAARCPYP